MLGAILAAAHVIESGVKVAGSITGGFGKVSPHDKKRIQAADSALAKALAGDQSALSYMVAQSNNSATDVGKEAFRRALDSYYKQKTGKSGTGYVQPSYSSEASSSGSSPLQDEVSNVVNNVRDDVAHGVRRIGAGVTNEGANAIAGTSSEKHGLTLPTNPAQLLIVAGVALGAYLIFKKH